MQLWRSSSLGFHVSPLPLSSLPPLSVFFWCVHPHPHHARLHRARSQLRWVLVLQAGIQSRQSASKHHERSVKHHFGKVPTLLPGFQLHCCSCCRPCGWLGNVVDLVTGPERKLPLIDAQAHLDSGNLTPPFILVYEYPVFWTDPKDMCPAFDVILPSELYHSSIDMPARSWINHGTPFFSWNFHLLHRGKLILIAIHLQIFAASVPNCWGQFATFRPLSFSKGGPPWRGEILPLKGSLGTSKHRRSAKAVFLSAIASAMNLEPNVVRRHTFVEWFSYTVKCHEWSIHKHCVSPSV